jgi:hypothetical protein
MARSIHFFRLSLTLLLVGGVFLGWLLGLDPTGSRAIAAGSPAAGITAQPVAPIAMTVTQVRIRHAYVWYYPLVYSEARKTIP